MTANDGPVPDGWEEYTGPTSAEATGAVRTVDGRCWVWQTTDPSHPHVGEWYGEVNNTPNGFDYQYFPTRAAAVAWCEATATAIPPQ